MFFEILISIHKTTHNPEHCSVKNRCCENVKTHVTGKVTNVLQSGSHEIIPVSDRKASWTPGFRYVPVSGHHNAFVLLHGFKALVQGNRQSKLKKNNIWQEIWVDYSRHVCSLGPQVLSNHRMLDFRGPTCNYFRNNSKLVIVSP